MQREGEMKESRFFEMLYGILLVPIVVIIGGTVLTFVFLAAHSNPNALLAWAAAFIVWLVLALEAFNRMIFDRQALPRLPLPGPMVPLEYCCLTEGVQSKWRTDGNKYWNAPQK